jgi:hypothetical protein
MEKSEDHKQCPECAEDIKVKAFRCRYCGATVVKKKKIEDGYLRWTGLSRPLYTIF